MCKWRDLRESEWAYLVPSPERGGVIRVYVLFPGTLERAWSCPVTCCLSKATFADGLWSRWRLKEAHVCVNIHFGAQLTGRR